MPANTHEEEDPVVASFDVFLTGSSSRTNTTAQPNSDSRLFMLQYPYFRPAGKPYSNATSQKPTQFRLKPNTGMVEVEIPFLGQEYFNIDTARRFGKALAENRTIQSGGSHGLAGGFASWQPARSVNLHDIPAHDDEHVDHIMTTHTLGGKIMKPSEHSPIYMLGSFRDNELHLTQLDAVLQVTPQFHHIDAEEENNNQKAFQAASGQSSKAKPGHEAPPLKLESKAIELKMKDNKEDPKDRNLNLNARLLRDIQAERWKLHDWVDVDDEESRSKARSYIRLDRDGDRAQLTSVITNGEWLDEICPPRRHGSKGLTAKVKGRDRERARRKKVEHQKRLLSSENAPSVPKVDTYSDSESSSVSDHSDVGVVNQSTGLRETDIKVEPGSVAAASSTASSVPDAVPTSSVAKRRGRPRKTQT